MLVSNYISFFSFKQFRKIYVSLLRIYVLEYESEWFTKGRFFMKVGTGLFVCMFLIQIQVAALI